MFFQGFVFFGSLNGVSEVIDRKWCSNRLQLRLDRGNLGGELWHPLL